jgi:4'-phosphopantetheinyl transferase
VTGDQVDIWLIRSDVPAGVLGDLAAVLDDAERGRAEALITAPHRRRFIATHGAVRLIIGQRLGVPPGQIRWRHGPHGKPELATAGDPAEARDDVHISLSHSGRLAMLAVTRHRRGRYPAVPRR